MAQRGQRRSIKRQVQRVKDRQNEIVQREIPLKIKRALEEVGVIVGNRANNYTPIEYGGSGGLIGSQERMVYAVSNGYRVGITYTKGYAVPLHGLPGDIPVWQPRPPHLKEGPSWNPAAVPNWINVADNETRQKQDDAVKEHLSL